MIRIKRKTKRFIGNMIVLLITIMICLVILEYAIRLVYPQTIGTLILDENMSFLHKPNKKFVVRHSEFQLPVEYTKEGLREDRVFQNEHSHLRIAAVGDSFVEALQVKINQSFVRQIQNQLTETDPDIEVINFGNTAYGTDQELNYYKYIVRGYEPNITVLFYCICNDIKDNYLRALYLVENGTLKKNYPLSISKQMKIRHLVESKSVLFTFLEHTIVNNEKIHRFLISRNLIDSHQDIEIKTDPRIDQFSETNFPDDAYEKTMLLIKQFNQEVLSDNGKFLVVIIPLKEQVDENLWKSSIFSKHIDSERNYINKRLQETLSDANITYIDLLPSLMENNENNSFFFTYDGHFNPKGHRFVADIVTSKIQTEYLI